MYSDGKGNSQQQAIKPKSKKMLDFMAREKEEQDEPPSFTLATLGLQRVGSIPPPKPKSQQPLQTLNARGMPARIRKRNRFFFDESIINDDKPLRMSLSPRKATAKIFSTPRKTTTKMLRKHKGIISRYMLSKAKSSKYKQKLRDSSLHMPTSKLRRNLHAQHTAKADASAKDASVSPSSTNTTSSSSVVIPADKKIGQRIGMRLRNLLKLPKAHKWVIFEWFYSFIDKAIFDGDYEFRECVADTFPNLKTYQLTRAEWRKVRSLMGKPRRCSSKFFEEERYELDTKRQKIRYLQSRRCGEIKDRNFIRNLPEKIPLPLPVGTKVTARLREPQDGIFSGTVDAFDSANSMYRVTFDRNGLGTHSIPDFEIVSENFHEMLPLHSITKDFRPNLMNVCNQNVNSASQSAASIRGGIKNVRSALNTNTNRNDPLLGQETIETPFKNPILAKDNVIAYPPKLLETLVRLKRALSIKKSKLQRLSDMNNEAELKASQQLTSQNNSSSSSSDESQYMYTDSSLQLSEEFQRRYASIVISMEKMNRDIQDYLNEIQTFATELTRDPQIQAMLTPSYLREKCREAAVDAVNRNNLGIIKNKSILNLIKKLATVLLVASHLSHDNSAQVSKVLEGCVEEVRSSLHGANVEIFQKNVQIHLHHIRLGIGQSAMNPPSSIVNAASVNISSAERNS